MKDYDIDKMQMIRDMWAENETQRPTRRNGKYPVVEDDLGRSEPSVMPVIFGEELDDIKYR